ncbi:hypothetical protein RSAG8_02940, partial [Rhizoctonia solani AG-8 WAC10335]
MKLHGVYQSTFVEKDEQSCCFYVFLTSVSQSRWERGIKIVRMRLSISWRYEGVRRIQGMMLQPDQYDW